MAATTVTIADETLHGERSEGLTLEFLTERVTLREVIRARVYQEVTEHNAAGATKALRGLLAQAVGPKRPPAVHRLDWREQYERALRAFASRGFLILVDDVQADDLDAELVLRHDTVVTFLRLVPLVGG